MLASAGGWGGGLDERPFLGRACSVARAERHPGEQLSLHFMLEAVGPGTARLCAAREGEQLALVGPLGRPFAAPSPDRHALLVGGGIGIAPLAILQDALLARGFGHTALLGFGDARHAAGASLLADAQVSTDDGSAGHHGLVTDLLLARLAQREPSIVYACGPRRCSRPCGRSARRRSCRRSSRWRRRWPAASARASAASCRRATGATCACASTAR